MSKEFIIQVLSMCASNLEFVNKRDKNIISEYGDLLETVEEALKLLVLTIDSTEIE